MQNRGLSPWQRSKRLNVRGNRRGTLKRMPGGVGGTAAKAAYPSRLAPRQHASHRPVGPAYENLRRPLKSILSIFNGPGLEQSHTGPTGREPNIQTERYKYRGPKGPHSCFAMKDGSPYAKAALPLTTALSRNKNGLLRFAFAIWMPFPLVELPGTAVR